MLCDEVNIRLLCLSSDAEGDSDSKNVLEEADKELLGENNVDEE